MTEQDQIKACTHSYRTQFGNESRCRDCDRLMETLPDRPSDLRATGKLVELLRRAASSVYLETDTKVAREISLALNKGADTIVLLAKEVKQSRTEIGSLQRDNKKLKSVTEQVNTIAELRRRFDFKERRLETLEHTLKIYNSRLEASIDHDRKLQLNVTWGIVNTVIRYLVFAAVYFTADHWLHLDGFGFAAFFIVAGSGVYLIVRKVSDEIRKIDERSLSSIPRWEDAAGGAS